MFKMPDLALLKSLPATLGQQKLIVLGATLATLVVTILGAAMLMAKPEMEVAYVGLSPHDAPRLSRVLRDSGIAYELSSDGTRLSARRGEVTQLRAFLAERGLPGTTGAGYELFDKVGPLGLTTFMQEVTKVRALEGEIARTIQALKGVYSARVHIALGEPTGFRRPRPPASASVVVRAEQPAAHVQAIRHIVAAAVPGLSTSDVRIVGTDGEVLAPGGDDALGGADRLVSLERTMARELQAKVARTLTPLFGHDSFETTATIRMQLDKRQTQQVEYDPATRVERSVRTMRETGTSSTGSGRNVVSVERNIPGDATQTTSGDTGRRSNQKRDEVTNYEVGSRSTASTVDGYRIEKLSLAVVLDARRLAELSPPSGSGSLPPERLAEIERLIVASVGADAARGDIVTVSVSEFRRPDGAPSQTAPWLAWLDRKSTVLIQGGMLVTVVLLLLMFGVRPAVRALERRPEVQAPTPLPNDLAKAAGSARTVTMQAAGGTGNGSQSLPGTEPTDEPATTLVRRLIESDPKRAAIVLKRWIRQEA